MEPLVRILEVERYELDGTPLRAGELAVEAGPGFVLEVRGSLEARELRIARIELVQDAMALWQLDPDGEGDERRSRFHAPVSAIPLPREFELVVRAELGDAEAGARARLGVVRGRRAALATGVRPRINPLMLTTASRTGSNLLLRALGGHPEIVAYRPFEYEPRVGAYWVEVLRELTEPGSYRRQITPQLRQPERGWWLGSAGAMPAPLLDREAEDEIARDTAADAARFCQERIDAVYGRIAPLCGREGAAYFAEKHSPNEVPGILSELYPEAREVFLVRDFRDMIASMLASNERRGEARFGRSEGDTDDLFVRRFRRFAANLAASWRRRADRAHLVRYEDLIGRPRETVAGLVAYLGLETSEETLAKMTDSLQLREEALEGHITSASPQASIGRWRSDLAPELRGATEEIFGAALALFGYEPSA